MQSPMAHTPRNSWAAQAQAAQAHAAQAQASQAQASQAQASQAQASQAQASQAQASQAQASQAQASQTQLAQSHASQAQAPQAVTPFLVLLPTRTLRIFEADALTAADVLLDFPHHELFCCVAPCPHPPQPFSAALTPGYMYFLAPAPGLAGQPGRRGPDSLDSQGQPGRRCRDSLDNSQGPGAAAARFTRHGRMRALPENPKQARGESFSSVPGWKAASLTPGGSGGGSTRGGFDPVARTRQHLRSLSWTSMSLQMEGEEEEGEEEAAFLGKSGCIEGDDYVEEGGAGCGKGTPDYGALRRAATARDAHSAHRHWPTSSSEAAGLASAEAHPGWHSFGQLDRPVSAGPPAGTASSASFPGTGAPERSGLTRQDDSLQAPGVTMSSHPFLPQTFSVLNRTEDFRGLYQPHSMSSGRIPAQGHSQGMDHAGPMSLSDLCSDHWTDTVTREGSVPEWAAPYPGDDAFGMVEAPIESITILHEGLDLDDGSFPAGNIMSPRAKTWDQGRRKALLGRLFGRYHGSKSSRDDK